MMQDFFNIDWNDYWNCWKNRKNKLQILLFWNNFNHFFYKRFATNKKQISNDMIFFSKIMKRFSDWKIMFFFRLKCFLWNCENHQYLNMFWKSKSFEIRQFFKIKFWLFSKSKIYQQFKKLNKAVFFFVIFFFDFLIYFFSDEEFVTIEKKNSNTVK